ncbi:MAG: hypothetical protein BWY63_02354 [Chloroflexi bacterium ADurb.Bin360]|nr:MAG: hypothetical protein BWY63_02354 [Chloroflexi bacterium ADurb.Bin360]
MGETVRPSKRKAGKLRRLRSAHAVRVSCPNARSMRASAASLSCRRRTLSNANASCSAMVCNTVTSSSEKASGSADCTSKTPITCSRARSGKPSSERVCGKSGLLNHTASAPTSRAIRGRPVTNTEPTIPIPASSRCPRINMRCPPSEEAARSCACVPSGFARKIPA